MHDVIANSTPSRWATSSSLRADEHVLEDLDVVCGAERRELAYNRSHHDLRRMEDRWTTARVYERYSNTISSAGHVLERGRHAGAASSLVRHKVQNIFAQLKVFCHLQRLLVQRYERKVQACSDYSNVS